jgi:hypothetical protein
MMQRRDFLKALSIGGGVAAFGGLGGVARLVQAVDTPALPDRYYIFCYFGGGWDILLGLDPKDPALYNAGNRSITKVEPGYDRLDFEGPALVEPVPGMQLGPFIGDLADHASKMTVVRGMSMETLTHQTGRRRFLTGRPPAGIQARGSSTDAWLAARLGREQPIPNLALKMESYNKDHPSYAAALRTNSVEDLVRALNPGLPELGAQQQQQLDELLAVVAACPRSQRSELWQLAEASRIDAAEVVASGLGDRFRFQGSGEGMAALRQHYGIPASGRLESSASAAAVAATAIKNGVSRCVSVQITSGLDTHFSNWETDQGERCQEGFDAVARLVEDLGTSPYKDTTDTWLDHTVIIGFSEFSRSPLLNTNGGRDHWLMNACFLLGGNIKGGQVIGASSEVGMNPQPVHLETGALTSIADGGEVVRPEHVLQALYEEVGITEEPDLRVSPLTALFA